MITAVRTSKRIALGGVLGIGLLFICLLAVKDMNDKLGVMTASNAGYQKMTDSQADRIKTLQSELEALRAAKVSELKAAQVEKDRLQSQSEELKRKFNELSKQNKECHSKLSEINDAKSHLESERDELKRLSGRQKQDSEKLSVQLRDQIARISMERDSCQRQYDALYKLHQDASDKVANLSNDKERLTLQLEDATSSTKSSKQLQPVRQQQSRSSSSQPVNLEEPHLPHHMSSTSKGGSPANVAPVGAEPPLNGSPEVVPLHQVRKEDVMEAPKVIQHFENLDAQVDSVQQDHPGLQPPMMRGDPVYRDNRNVNGDVAFDEDDIEDTADGQIPQNYLDDKVSSRFHTKCILLMIMIAGNRSSLQ